MNGEKISPASSRGVTAVLGPTNTGKTHLAIERMVSYESGIIGLPLRLLAREVYGKVVAKVGEHNVALVTGEEKIMPDRPRFWVCTVEAMPLDVPVDFVAIDEVQMAHSLERGHIFTDRVLNLRGSTETLFLGSLTARNVLETLIPDLNVIVRPRLSELTYAGAKKISRLARRSAIVAFSAQDVYAIAELIRRQSGGAAVVLGSLSPRTRNAQVELFQDGDVDYLVATDAIGMGLNLDVDHVALASIHKFDGFQFRDLTPAELGQVVGRAGRYTRNGTFGVTSSVEAFSTDLVEKLESHSFEPLKVFQWRTSNLDFSSLTNLRESLDVAPQSPIMVKAPVTEDVVTLEAAMRDGETRDMVANEDDVRRLWDVCSMPDYRKISPAEHADLVFTVFRHLQRHGAVKDDWLAGQIAYADRLDGDIDTISHRLAHIRTWTYLANRSDWVEKASYWQQQTRDVEDRLSDALHERLTQKFVDRRTSVLMKKLKESTMLEAEVTKDGEVIIASEIVGTLQGLRFAPASDASSGSEEKTLKAAAQKALASEIEKRSHRIAAAPNEAFVLSSDGMVRWLGAVVARVVGGEDFLSPNLIVLADEHLSGSDKERVDHRLKQWLDNHIKTTLGPLIDLRAGDGLEGLARGLAFRLVEAYGVLDRRDVLEDVKNLDQDARASLRKFGVRFGAYHIFVPVLLKPAPASLLSILWGLQNDDLDNKGISEVPQQSAAGRTSFQLDPEIPAELYRVAGFKVSGTRVVRVDILERLADLIRPLLSWKPTTEETTPPDGALNEFGFTVTVAMTSLLGCSGDDFASVLTSLGYRVERREIPAEPVPSEETQVESQDGLELPKEASVSDEDASEETEKIPEQPALADETEEVTATGIESIAPEAAAALEPKFLEIWRPQAVKRPQRPGSEASAKRNRGSKRNASSEQQGGRSGQNTDKPKQKPRKGQKSKQSPGRSEKAVKLDPDSPFAKLAALKEGMKKD